MQIETQQTDFRIRCVRLWACIQVKSVQVCFIVRLNINWLAIFTRQTLIFSCGQESLGGILSCHLTTKNWYGITVPIIPQSLGMLVPPFQGRVSTVKYLTSCLSAGIGKITGSCMTQYDFPPQNNQFLFGTQVKFEISHPYPLISHKNQIFSPPF